MSDLNMRLVCESRPILLHDTAWEADVYLLVEGQKDCQYLWFTHSHATYATRDEGLQAAHEFCRNLQQAEILDK